MTFTVETGAGTPGANALASVAFVTTYLTSRGRELENDWSSKTAPEKQALIIAATDYIETRFGQRFKGSRLRALIVGREASGTLALASVPTDGDELTIGLKTYRLVAVLAQENDVLIGADVAETIANLVAAVGGSEGLGVSYAANTLPNYEVVALEDDGELLIVAQAKGENGNLIAFATDIAGATITGSGFLEDGLDESEQPLSFPRRGLYSRDGRPVTGVPLKVRQATAEYAVRAAAATLAPDPTVDASLTPVVRVREKTGPLESEIQYAEGGVATLIKPYPAADRLLDEFVTAGGGCIR